MKTLLSIVLSTACVMSLVSPVRSQEMSNVERGWAQDMLKTVSDEIKKNYYDPKLHGVDWDAKVAQAQQKIAGSSSLGAAMLYIAATVDSLNDSHTYFYPPRRAQSYDYGIAYQFVGERCYVTHVRAGSDAASKGVQPGYEILTINGHIPERKDTWKLDYLFNVLSPQPFLNLLLQLPPNGASREFQVQAKMRMLKRPTDVSRSDDREYDSFRRYLHVRTVEYGSDLIIVKFPNFYFSNLEIAEIMNKAQRFRTMIMDLRGNSGGSADTMQWFVGGVFDKPVKIADRVTRKQTKELIAKPPHHVFTGKLIVLVDSQSASAAEIFARVVQLEKRGSIIGDATSASVMEAKHFSNSLGGTLALFYGESITVGDLIMTDGKSLEHIGVTPDIVTLPTQADLTSGSDPVLARAAEMSGVKLTPEAAGRLFPYEWEPDPE